MNHLDEIKEFASISHTSEHIADMEMTRDTAIGYMQYIGECVNQAEARYALELDRCLSELKSMDEETETTRKAKLNAMTAPLKREWQDLKNLLRTLNAIRFSMMQSIKTRTKETNLR